MSSYIKILRPLNLLIIAFTQYFLYVLIVLPQIQRLDLNISLVTPYLGLFILVTVLIAASGNLVNDIFDNETDIQNKPEKTYIGLYISKRQAWIFYVLLIVLGAIVAGIVGFATNKQQFIFIYPLAVLVLFFYSYKLKHYPLLGNLIVASFTGFVVWVLILSDDAILNGLHLPAAHLLIAFGWFSFMANFAREIVKDIEDQEGDQNTKSKTLPIMIGLVKTKWAIFIILLLLLTGLIYARLNYLVEAFDFRATTFMVVFLMAPIVLFALKLFRAKEKKSFTALSRFLKMYLIAGLLFCLLLSQNYFDVTF